MSNNDGKFDELAILGTTKAIRLLGDLATDSNLRARDPSTHAKVSQDSKPSFLYLNAYAEGKYVNKNHETLIIGYHWWLSYLANQTFFDDIHRLCIIDQWDKPGKTILNEKP